MEKKNESPASAQAVPVAGSVGDDPEFVRRMQEWYGDKFGNQGAHAKLVAYLDSRSAPAAPSVDRNSVLEEVAIFFEQPLFDQQKIAFVVSEIRALKSAPGATPQPVAAAQLAPMFLDIEFSRLMYNYRVAKDGIELADAFEAVRSLAFPSPAAAQAVPGGQFNPKILKTMCATWAHAFGTDRENVDAMTAKENYWLRLLAYVQRFASPSSAAPSQEAQPLAASAVQEGFTLDQIADACIDADINGSKYESLCLSLAAAPRQEAQPAVQEGIETIRVAAAEHGYVLALAGLTTLNECAKYGWHAGEVQQIYERTKETFESKRAAPSQQPAASPTEAK